MKILGALRPVSSIASTTRLLQFRNFQPDFVPKTKPIKYKYPSVYGPRPVPFEKIIQLADKIASLLPAERMLIGPNLCIQKWKLFQLKAWANPAKVEEKKAEKTAFNVKLEMFDAAAKIRVIKEVRAFTDSGLKEAKDIVENVPSVLKLGVTKEEAISIIEKIKAAGGVAVME